ncbi:nicotinamide mononucleotide transporter [Candidatus Pacearchaeota archaeon]|nr:nicotinamide mononucleotide transporter [Candidatus Pacearchaeota archaeon]
MEALTWVMAASCVIGAILNAKKSIIGFYIWLPTNIMWVLFSLRLAQYAQASLFAVYTVIAIIGIKNWRKTNG